MGTKGLTKEMIVAEAMACIAENEQPVVSLHEIARRLAVKPPSLYNYIKSTKELQYAVLQNAIDRFVENQNKATEGRQKDEAIKAFAEAYHSFAMENKGLYRLIMSIPSEKDNQSKEMAVPLLNTVVRILSDYGLSEEAVAHWQRVFRAILHGFISEEYVDYFYYYDDIDLKKSWNTAIQCFLDGLHGAVKAQGLK